MMAVDFALVAIYFLSHSVRVFLFRLYLMLRVCIEIIGYLSLTCSLSHNQYTQAFICGSIIMFSIDLCLSCKQNCNLFLFAPKTEKKTINDVECGVYAREKIPGLLFTYNSVWAIIISIFFRNQSKCVKPIKERQKRHTQTPYGPPQIRTS